MKEKYFALSLCLLLFPFAASAQSDGPPGADTAETPAPLFPAPSAVPGKWALGLIYPGAALRYAQSEKTSWEGKLQFGSDIVIAGGRFYRRMGPVSGLDSFWGLEADYIDFKGRVSKGSGFAVGAFAGCDVPLSRSMFLSADFGPMYIDLSDSATEESVSGIDYILNLGVYWKF